MKIAKIKIFRTDYYKMKITHLFSALAFVLWAGNITAQSQNHEVFYESPEYEQEWIQPSLHPDRIMLNFGADPTTTASATWRTNTEIDTAYAEIAKATAAPKFWRTAKRFTAKTTLLDGSKVIDAGIVANYHSVTFNELEPNTLYGYRVGDGEHWSEWFQFTTASETNDKFSFLYMGDAQNNILELWSRSIRKGFQLAPDARFIVHAGDLRGKPHSEEEWEEWFRAGSFIHGMIPSLPTPGTTHEYGPLYEGQADSLEQLSIQWRPQFTLPENGPKGIDELKETAYYMDFQGVRMISVNSCIYLEEQAEWLREILANNPNKWTIVTYHHPLYPISRGRSDSKRRELLKPIFDEFHVDLALQGHDHAYARGRATEHNLISGTNNLDQTGTVYVVSVGGGKMYRLSENGWQQWGAKQDRNAENTQLVQVITVDHDTLRYQSYTATGDLYDAFDLVKNTKGPNTLVDRKSGCIDARYFNNTIAYHEELPLNIKNIVLEKYKGFKIEIDKVEKNFDFEIGIYYEIDLENDTTDVELEIKITEAGVIFEEELAD
jgi:hypothetical protein